MSDFKFHVGFPVDCPFSETPKYFLLYPIKDYAQHYNKIIGDSDNCDEKTRVPNSFSDIKQFFKINKYFEWHCSVGDFNVAGKSDTLAYAVAGNCSNIASPEEDAPFFFFSCMLEFTSEATDIKHATINNVTDEDRSKAIESLKDKWRTIKNLNEAKKKVVLFLHQKDWKKLREDIEPGQYTEVFLRPDLTHAKFFRKLNESSTPVVVVLKSGDICGLFTLLGDENVFLDSSGSRLAISKDVEADTPLYVKKILIVSILILILSAVLITKIIYTEPTASQANAISSNEENKQVLIPEKIKKDEKTEVVPEAVEKTKPDLPMILPGSNIEEFCAQASNAIKQEEIQRFNDEDVKNNCLKKNVGKNFFKRKEKLNIFCAEADGAKKIGDLNKYFTRNNLVTLKNCKDYSKFSEQKEIWENNCEAFRNDTDKELIFQNLKNEDRAFCSDLIINRKAAEFCEDLFKNLNQLKLNYLKDRKSIIEKYCKKKESILNRLKDLDTKCKEEDIIDDDPYFALKFCQLTEKETESAKKTIYKKDCSLKEETFKEELKKRKTFSNPKEYENLKKEMVCKGFNPKFIEECDYYEKTYFEGLKMQTRNINVKLNVPDYISSGMIKGEKPDTYIEFKCQGCDVEKLEEINKYLKKKVEKSNDIEVLDIALDWNPTIQYTIKIKDKKFLGDEVLEEFKLETNQLCGYREFNIKKQGSNKKVFGDKKKLKITITQQTNKDMDCPWFY